MSQGADQDRSRKRFIALQIGRIMRLADVEDPFAILQEVLLIFVQEGPRPLPTTLIDVLNDLAADLEKADNPDGHATRRTSKRGERRKQRQTRRVDAIALAKQQTKIAILRAYERLEKDDPGIAADFVRILDRVIKRFQREATGESREQKLRRDQRRSESPSSGIQSSTKSDARPTDEELEEAMRLWGTLTDREREAYVLCMIVDLSSEQAAIVMGCAPATVRSLVRTAKKKLGEYGQP